MTPHRWKAVAKSLCKVQFRRGHQDTIRKTFNPQIRQSPTSSRALPLTLPWKRSYQPSTSSYFSSFLSQHLCRSKPRNDFVHRVQQSSYPKFYRSSCPKQAPCIILKSSFPTKTALFLVVVAGLVYYFELVTVETSDLLSTHFQSPENGMHFMVLQDTAALAEFLEGMQDISSELQDPKLLNTFNDAFSLMVGGFEFDEADGKEEAASITHGCSVYSNVPGEDTLQIAIAPGPGGKSYNFWSIFDGHAGFHTSQVLQHKLHPYLSRTLCGLPETADSNLIAESIKSTFVHLDNEIMNNAQLAINWSPVAHCPPMQNVLTAFSGSCALTAAFDPVLAKLHVACTGDSRAVLGRWDNAAGKYVAQPLSVDQTGFNDKEVERITVAHPDEPDIIDPKTGRLLGMAVTRAFGDHRWKWDESLINKARAKFWGQAPRPNTRTPPYMTAEPEVTTTDIVRGDLKQGVRSDFLIMASDGLWDRMTSEHAVECVERWMEAREKGNGMIPLPETPLERIPPLREGIDYEATAEGPSWKATPDFFAIQDNNAAACLLRNAMGGTRFGLVFGLMNMGGPQSRSAADDTTILVVFFDRNQGVVANGALNGKKRKSFWLR